MVRDARGVPAEGLKQEDAAPATAGAAEARRRGRPTSDSARQVCESLLTAAEQCLQTKRYANITVREVAAAAGVNPAMVNYYFNGKEGLFIALVEFLFSDWSRRLRAIELKPLGPGPSPTRQFVEAVRACFYEHRTVLWLIDQELADSDSPISTAFKRRLASQSTQAIRQFVKTMGERGVYRRDLDLRYAAYSVAALAIHPFTFARRMERSYHIRPEELNEGEWLSFLERSLERLLGPA